MYITGKNVYRVFSAEKREKQHGSHLGMGPRDGKIFKSAFTTHKAFRGLKTLFLLIPEYFRMWITRQKKGMKDITRVFFVFFWQHWWAKLTFEISLEPRQSGVPLDGSTGEIIMQYWSTRFDRIGKNVYTRRNKKCLCHGRHKYLLNKQNKYWYTNKVITSW